ncbi:melanocortin receptor 4-like [Oculina patagonica]
MQDNATDREFSIDCFFLNFTGKSTKFQDALKIFICVVNSMLVLPTVLLNGLVIVTIWKPPSLYSSPSNILLLCLACADFMNGLLTQPVAVIHLVGEITWDARLFCIPGVVMESAAWFASGISGTTVLALSVDRFLAVYMHLRYNEIVTVRRTSTFVAAIWPVFTVNIFARLIGVNTHIFATVNVVVIFVCLVTIMLIYYKIFRIVSYHRVQIQAQVLAASQSVSVSVQTVDEFKARKSLMTVVYIVGLFWLCYLPFACVIVSYLIVGLTPSIRTAYGVTATVVFANSVINPGLYCWRIAEIRQALLKCARKLLCKVDR